MPPTIRILKDSAHGQTRIEAYRGRFQVVKECLPEYQPLLQREADNLRRLHSLEGIPTLLESTPGRLVRSYVPGRTLKELLGQRVWPAAQKRRWLERLASLLESIHQAGTWHGDVAPANIMVSEDNRISLVDWGDEHWGTPPYRQVEHSGPEADWAAYRKIGEELGLSGVREEGRDCSRLVGREPELATLRQLWHSASYSDGLWVGLSAPSGGGKSAVLEHLLNWTPNAALGRCTTLSSPLSYQLFQSVLEHSGWPLQQEAMGDASWRQFQATFPGSAGTCVATAPGTPFVPLLLADAWESVLMTQAETSPLLLVLDDLQWADDSSLQLLHALRQRPIGSLLVVMAWREEHRPALPTPHVQISLGALNADAVRSWAEEEELELSSDQAESIAQWTRGNPLLVREWLSNPENPRFSVHFADLVRGRLASFSPEQLNLLRRAALMGTRFSPQALGASAKEVLTQAEQQQLVIPGGRFTHDQVRESLLNDMTESEKQAGHAELARYFLTHEPDNVVVCAYHLAQAGQVHDTLTLAAARYERNRGALQSALYFYEFCPSIRGPEFVIDQVLEYTDCCTLSGRYGEAVERVNTALRTATGVDRVRLLLNLGRLHYLMGNPADSLAPLQLCRQEKITDPRLAGTLIRQELESSFHSGDRKLYFSVVLKRWRELHRIWQSDLIGKIYAVLLVHCVVPRISCTSMYRRLLVQVHREREPVARFRTISRVLTLRYGIMRPQVHQRFLRAAVNFFEDSGDPWELLMALMQLGLFAWVEGRFGDLLQFASRLRQVADLSHDPTALFVAQHFEVLGTGGRLPASRLQLQTRRSSNLKFHRTLALAHFASRQGKDEEAWGHLDRLAIMMPLDQSLISVVQATVLRTWADRIPRRWARRRHELYTKALHCAQKCFSTGTYGRMFHFRAQRELALALVGLGRPEEGLRWIQRSVREAHDYGATYEEALSRQAWGNVECWPDWENQKEQGRRMLERLGAWWELVPEPAGLPILEVSQDARDYLTNPTSEVRTRLQRWVTEEWLERLDQVRRENQRRREEAEQVRARLQRETARWQRFLQQGPVQVQRFDRQGRRLEGPASVEGLEHRINLENGEFAVLSMPVARRELSLCQALVQAQIENAQQHVQRLQAKARALPPGRWKGLLETELEKLEQWHLGTLPEHWESGWYQEGLQIEQSGTVPWERLGLEARSALLGVLREALQNARQHATGPVSLRFTEQPDELWTEIHSGPPRLTGVRRHRSFGLDSMRFRASLAGGSLRLVEGYRLQLRLPLLP